MLVCRADGHFTHDPLDALVFLINNILRLFKPANPKFEEWMFLLHIFVHHFNKNRLNSCTSFPLIKAPWTADLWTVIGEDKTLFTDHFCVVLNRNVKVQLNSCRPRVWGALCLNSHRVQQHGAFPQDCVEVWECSIGPEQNVKEK